MAVLRAFEFVDFEFRKNKIFFYFFSLSSDCNFLDFNPSYDTLAPKKHVARVVTGYELLAVNQSGLLQVYNADQHLRINS